ncbi:sigma-70 family RNA polymerase sigma factor [Robertmurraya massiliosenegalensis]|uniref:sigma-70 family RNA polymerase sigma factor n=1 Tax=Robertmurraya TaxID=2837507 RepID=UPI0039A73CFA
MMGEENDYEEIRDIWFERIMDQYGDRLTKLSYNYLKDWNLAEDTVQDVFITCYKEYDKISEIVSFKAWIYRITINKCKDMLKSSLFKKVIINTDLFKRIISSEFTPEMSVMRKSEDEYLSLCVLELPLKYREVITLYYYEELPIDEISEVLRIKRNTVKTRLSRARLKLKTILERGR